MILPLSSPPPPKIRPVKHSPHAPTGCLVSYPKNVDLSPIHSMKNSSSKTDNNASTHPLHDQGPPKGEKVELRENEGEHTQSEDNKKAQK